MKERWEYRPCHVVADDEISISGAEVFAEASGSLAERSVPVCPLALGFVEFREKECSAVE